MLLGAAKQGKRVRARDFPEQIVYLTNAQHQLLVRSVAYLEVCHDTEQI